MLARRIRHTQNLMLLGFLGFFTYIAAHKASARPPQPQPMPIMAGVTAAGNQA
ncbi:MAG: hypothetical protein IT438_13295 [Phycisphaerales bacterium]|nr:hypothetical protein [Phycisphaerales bacterium]